MRARDLPASALDEPQPPGAACVMAEPLHAVLSAANEAILRATSRDDLYQRVCAAATRSGHIVFAAVLVPDADTDGVLCVAASSGPTHLPGMRISVDASRPEGRGMAGIALQSRLPRACNDLHADPHSAPWLDALAAAGVSCGAALPVLRDGACAGVLLFYSPLRGAFDDATVRLLERLVENVCYALDGLERDAERARLSEELQRFRAAIDWSGDAVYLTDVETMRFVDVNETACRRLGYTRAELLTMGPAHMTPRPLEEVRALCERVIACAPEAIVTEQIVTARDGRTWFSEVSRRALKSGGRWMIVTMARDVDERRRHQHLQALQIAVTHQLAQPGTTRSVLEAVLAALGAALPLQRGACVTAGDGGAPRRLADWQCAKPAPAASAAATIPDFDDAKVLSVALRARPGAVAALANADACVVPLHADGKTLGALALRGPSVPCDAQLEHVLVAIGEQTGQYIRRKQAEAVLARSEARFRALTELSSDWYWECDKEHRFIQLDGRSMRDGGARDWRSGLFGHRVWELPHVVKDSCDWDAHRAQLQRCEPFSDVQFAMQLPDGTLRWTSASGEPVYDADGTFVGYLGVSRDITQRRRAENSIRHLATHDTLTGLPNRAQFIEALSRAVREARLAARQLALLFVDLDHFKAINDTLGHDAGDALLVRLATAMRAVLRPDDLLARLGGDEFVVLLRDPVGHHEPPGHSEGDSQSAHARQMADQAAAVARKLLAAATQPIPLKGRECRVSASIGICTFPDHASDEASLMMGADIAMYEAKRDGRNGFRHFFVGPA